MKYEFIKIIMRNKTKNLKGQNFIIEFILLSFLGIILILGIFSFHNVVFKPLYDTNIKTQIEIITYKIHMGERIFKKYNIREGIFTINIPKRINDNTYSLKAHNTKTLIFKVGNDIYFKDVSQEIKSDIKSEKEIYSNDGVIKINYSSNTLTLMQKVK